MYVHSILTRSMNNRNNPCSLFVLHMPHINNCFVNLMYYCRIVFINYIRFCVWLPWVPASDGIVLYKHDINDERLCYGRVSLFVILLDEYNLKSKTCVSSMLVCK